jgi:hypothetical protein
MPPLTLLRALRSGRARSVRGAIVAHRAMALDGHVRVRTELMFRQLRLGHDSENTVHRDIMML